MNEPMHSGQSAIALHGALDFSAVPAVWASVRDRLVPGAVVRVDLQEVAEIDSAALAMIVDWAGQAERLGAKIVLEQVPPKLVALASISDLDELLQRLSSD